jgi:Protein of unknown function (DUF992)
MSWKLSMTMAALTLAVGLNGVPSMAQQSGVKAGTLTCDVEGGWGIVFGSSRDLKCTYDNGSGRSEHYTGHVDKFGVDIGYHAGGIVAWLVIAPTADIGKGALAGSYGGVTGGAAVGVGGAANVLVGGSKNTISLQPLSLEGITGLNVAAGLARIELTAAN